MTDHGRGISRSLARTDMHSRWWDDNAEGRLARVSFRDWQHALALEMDEDETEYARRRLDLCVGCGEGAPEPGYDICRECAIWEKADIDYHTAVDDGRI